MLKVLMFILQMSSASVYAQAQLQTQPPSQPPSQPGSSSGDQAVDAAMKLGQIHFQKREYSKSYESYYFVFKNRAGSPRFVEALAAGSQSLLMAGRTEDTLKLTEQALGLPNLTDRQVADFLLLRGRIFDDRNDYWNLFDTWFKLSQRHPTVSEQLSYSGRAIELIRDQLRELELEKITKEPAYGNLRADAHYRLAEIAIETRNKSLAKDHLLSIIDGFAGSEVEKNAKEKLSLLELTKVTEPYNIGVVLPLTGKHAQIARKTLRGLQIGLGLINNSTSKYKLFVADSEANPDQARRGVEKLVVEDNVIAIVGSLLSKTAMAVAQKANELEVPSIALSQKSGVTAIGEYVFRNAFTSEGMVQELVRHSMETLGYKRFAVLYPNDTYGVEFANLFMDEVQARGGQIRGLQTYHPKETDFRESIQRLVGTFYYEDRWEEFQARLKHWTDQQKKLSSTKGKRNAPKVDELMPPVVDFDALFIPDGVKALGQIAPMIAYNNVRNLRLLGTNIWNNPTLTKRGGNYIENCVFVDGLFASDPKFQASSFVQLYQKMYNEDPGLFEIQAYETALILRSLIDSGIKNREDLMRGLNTLKDFPGVLGQITTNESREMEKPLYFLTVEKGNIKSISK